MADLSLSEFQRRAAKARWDKLSPEERTKAVEPAAAARRAAKKTRRKRKR